MNNEEKMKEDGLKFIQENDPDALQNFVRAKDRELWKAQYKRLLEAKKVPSREDLAYTVSVLVQCLDETRQHTGAGSEWYWKATHVMNELSELNLIDWQR